MQYQDNSVFIRNSPFARHVFLKVLTVATSSVSLNLHFDFDFDFPPTPTEKRVRKMTTNDKMARDGFILAVANDKLKLKEVRIKVS